MYGGDGELRETRGLETGPREIAVCNCRRPGNCGSFPVTQRDVCGKPIALYE